MSGLSSLDIGKLKIKSAASKNQRKQEKQVKSAPPSSSVPEPLVVDEVEETLSNDGLFAATPASSPVDDDLLGSSSETTALGFLGRSDDEVDAETAAARIDALLGDVPGKSTDALFASEKRRPERDAVDDDFLATLDKATTFADDDDDDDDDEQGDTTKDLAENAPIDTFKVDATSVADDFDYAAYIESQANDSKGGLFDD